MIRDGALRLHSLKSKTREAMGLRSRDYFPTLVVGVSGGSGSGKTTFCNMLEETIGAEAVLHLRQDDYYRDLSALSPQERDAVNFDHPDAVEFDLLQRHLDLLSQNKDIAVPCYDFKTHTRSHYTRVLSSKPIILVEGILLFADPGVRMRCTKKIFVDAPERVRYERRLARDVKERGRTPESVHKQFFDTVKPMHDVFVEPFKAIADDIISGEMPFEDIVTDMASELFEFIIHGL